MDYELIVLADSIGQHGVRLTTVKLRYPRAAAHEDILTHRALSRNASSSRAIPVARMLERADWMPEAFGLNQKGMGAERVLDNPKAIDEAQRIWRTAMRCAHTAARQLMDLGVAKEDANLLLRPFEWIDVVMSATDWGNFFHQRAREQTGLVRRQVRRVAQGVEAALAQSKPQLLQYGQWHLPYVSGAEALAQGFDWSHQGRTLAKASAMRCARTSYARHDGTMGTIDEDAAACEAKLIDCGHWSPLEHPAKCAQDTSEYGEDQVDYGNYQAGWLQLRKHYSQEYVRASDQGTPG